MPRIRTEWDLSEEELRDLLNAGALDLIAETVDAGAPPEAARSWWVSYLTQQANSRGVALDELPITPSDVARVIALVAAGELNNKLARQVVDGVLVGDGTPGHPDWPHLGVALMRPRARGRVTLVSADPMVPPLIEHHYDSEPADIAKSVSPSSPAERSSTALASAIREAQVAKAMPARANTTKTAVRADTTRSRGRAGVVMERVSLGRG